MCSFATYFYMHVCLTFPDSVCLSVLFTCQILDMFKGGYSYRWYKGYTLSFGHWRSLWSMSNQLSVLSLQYYDSFQLICLLHLTEAVHRWASSGLCVKQGSLSIWSAALPSAPWWGRCLPRRGATAGWKSEHANGPWWELQTTRFSNTDLNHLVF